MDMTLLTTVLNGVMNSRRKPARRARHFLAGRGGSLLSNPATLMAAAGLAWGVYETLQSQGTATGRAAAGTGPSGGTPPSTPPPGEVTPPIPDAPSAAVPSAGVPSADVPSTDLPSDVVRMIRLAVSAANADGALNEHERAAILQQAAPAGASDLIEAELRQPQPLSSIVAGVDAPDEAATLYVLAFTVLRADERVTGAERIYLAQLAHLLHLDNDTVARLERDTSERIDVLGDQGQPGG
jgi:uncharacterized membrane protein YebE (DUF533 family)